MAGNTSNPAYLPGFGSYLSSEALPDALPKGQNNPQVCPYGLYAEQLSGTAFTMQRSKNRFSWLYRARPSALNNAKHKPLLDVHPSLTWVKDPNSVPSSETSEEFELDPNQMRWDPIALPNDSTKVTFLEGVTSMAKGGDATQNTGCEIYLYAFNSDMTQITLTNRDGDFLFVPQHGSLTIQTEFGILKVSPSEICVIQRGMPFSISIDPVEGKPKSARGYLLELHEGHFELPELGPIGANGLANQRDFLSPTAYFNTFPNETRFDMVVKYGGKFYSFVQKHTPFDVVAWHGNYTPYKYDLRRFCCINSVTYDHPDPSIYTVLTAPSSVPGTAAMDFVIFPPRWMVMEHSFRPPWFHKNVMTEYMGLIWGNYDAKSGGFQPGGSSLHPSMSSHGPDQGATEAASNPKNKLEPKFFNEGLAFMFETSYPLKLSRFARLGLLRQMDYQSCWSGLECNFDPEWRDKQQKPGTLDDDNLILWRKQSDLKSKL